MSKGLSEQLPSSERLLKILAAGGLVSWHLHRGESGQLVPTVSDSFLKLTGLTFEEIPPTLNDFLAKFTTPDDGQIMASEIQRVMSDGGDFNLEHRFIGPCSPYNLISFGSPEEYDSEGRPQKLTIFSRPLFFQRSNHQDEGFSPFMDQKRLDTVMGMAKIGVWDWDVPSGRIRINHQLADMLGYDISEMRGCAEERTEISHPDDRPGYDENISSILAGPENLYAHTYRLKHKGGHYIWLYETGRVIERDDHGRALRIVGVHFNVNERKNLEEAQQKALSTIAEQKAAIEAQMAEKDLLLGDVQCRLADIIDRSGQKAGCAGLGQTELSPESGEFASYLNQAFSFIASQMAWFKAILDSLPFPVGVFDQDENWLYLNQPSAELYGGQGIKDFLGQPNTPCLIDFQDSQVSTKGNVTSFKRYLPATGRLFQGRSTVLKGLDGQADGRIEVLNDVTEANDAEERTHIMLDAMPLACNFWDDQFRNIDCNQAAAILFDLPSKEAYLKHFFELSPEFQPNGRPSAELAREHVTKALREGQDRFQWMHQKLDGTPIPSEITLVRVARRNGFIVAGYTRDLRELKRTQAERDMERQLLRKVMDSAPICFTITVGGTVKFLTPFARNFTGKDVGDSIRDIYDSAEVWDDLSRELEEKQVVNWRTVCIKNADDQARTMLLNAFKSDYYGEGGVMSWLMDVTDLKQARDAAEESTRAKSEFLANMSHEIRTPMNAILGLIHLVMQTELTELQREYLQKTEGAAKTLLRIINDILDFSKIEAGKLEMEKEEFDLTEVLQQVVDLVSTRAHEKGLEFLLRVPPDTPAGLVGDQVRLAQVLSNLVSNAGIFTAHGLITASAETNTETDDSANLQFQVEDTGIGLTSDQAANLFEAFKQAEASTTRRFGGTGLGLAISKSLVNLMGGQIWCQSAVGQGSIFGFTATFALHNSGKRYVSKRKDFRGLNALIIDDNVVALDILNDFLKTLGFSVVTASSGQEAINILTEKDQASRHFDLVFIDWKMPDMDGIETSNRIHELIAPNKLPVIIMATAYNRDDVLGQAKESGISNVLTKPLSPSTLLNVLVDIFGRGLPAKASKLKKAHEMAVVKEYAGAKILLAEDNEVNQLVASRILKNAGLEVDVANNGRQAVEMLQAGNYDLVLMDIQMPEMDGITATKEIRKLPEYANLPIVAMTAHAMSGDRELSIQAGMNDHINKPINLQELFSTLAKWLRKKPH